MAKITTARKSQALATREDNRQVVTPMQKLQDQLQKRKEKMVQEMAPGLNVQAQIGAVMALANANDYLFAVMRQNPASLFAAVYQANRLGLSLDPDLKQAYLVPFGGKEPKVQLIPDYRGLLLIAIQSGMILAGKVNLVYSNEEFEEVVEVVGGKDNSRLKHRPKLADRGHIIGGYTKLTLPGDVEAYRVVPIEDVEKIRLNSPSVRKKRPSPWDTHYDQMVIKTIFKQGLKFVPMTPRVAEAVAVDDGAEMLDGEITAQVVDLDQDFNPDRVATTRTLSTDEEVDREEVTPEYVGTSEPDRRSGGLFEDDELPDPDSLRELASSV